MKNAQLSLDASYPTLVHLISDPEGSRDSAYDVECDVQVWQGANNERRWRVQLRVKFKPKATAVATHRGEVTYVGFFTVVDECPKETMYRLIGVDAPSILYSAIRELVALLTGRSSTKAVLLPTVSFIGGIVESPANAPTQGDSVRAEKRPGAHVATRRKTASVRPKAKLQVT